MYLKSLEDPCSVLPLHLSINRCQACLVHEYSDIFLPEGASSKDNIRPLPQLLSKTALLRLTELIP